METNSSATDYPKTIPMPPLNKLQNRLPPWDEEMSELLGEPTLPFDKTLTQEMRLRPLRQEIFRLRGWCVFDPTRATSEDIRQFLWAGLRVLRAQAKARGLAEEEVRRLLMSAFDVFHDASESIWTALKTVVSSEGGVHKHQDEVAPPNAAFVASEEDRPVLFKIGQHKPLTLLDPDAELLASFEP